MLPVSENVKTTSPVAFCEAKEGRASKRKRCDLGWAQANWGLPRLFGIQMTIVGHHRSIVDHGPSCLLSERRVLLSRPFQFMCRE